MVDDDHMGAWMIGAMVATTWAFHFIAWLVSRNECDCTYAQFVVNTAAGIADIARHLW